MPQSRPLLASRQQGSFMYNSDVSQSNHPTMCPIIILKATPRNGYRDCCGYLKGLENMEVSILSNRALSEFSVCTVNAKLLELTFHENKRLLHDQMNDNTLQTCLFFVYTWDYGDFIHG